MTIHKLRQKKVLRRIGELLALGMNPEDIREAIDGEYKIKADTDTIKRVIKMIHIRKREVLHDNEKTKEIYEEMINTMIKEVEKNLKILNSTRDIVLDKLNEAIGSEQSREITALNTYIEEIKNTKDWAVVHDKVKSILKILKAPSFSSGMKLMYYVKEVNSSIRTQNDTIKTLNEVLKRLETKTQETEVSSTKVAQLSQDALKDLEDAGIITIHKEYYLMNEKEDKNGIKIKRKTKRDKDEADGRADSGEEDNA